MLRQSKQVSAFKFPAISKWMALVVKQLKTTTQRFSICFFSFNLICSTVVYTRNRKSPDIRSNSFLRQCRLQSLWLQSLLNSQLINGNGDIIGGVFSRDRSLQVWHFDCTFWSWLFIAGILNFILTSLITIFLHSILKQLIKWGLKCS